MSTREIERLDGSGTIVRDDGSEIGKRRYYLTMVQRMTKDGGGQTVGGPLDIQGRIALQGDEGYTLISYTDLTLTLADGRSLPFFFSNSDGTIVARGHLDEVKA